MIMRNLAGLDDDNKGYAIQVYQNENLQKLFLNGSSIKITGKAFFHYNPQLCM